MPEGDTVFITAGRLRQALVARPVTRFELRVPSLALASEIGAAVLAVEPVGKHLLMRFSSGHTLHSHLRMDGAWRVGPAEQRSRGGPDHAIRALVGNAQWLAAGFRVHDLALVPTSDESQLIGHLGPDLLSPEFDLDEGLRRFAERPARPIGEALLDQRLVAGIGNVYKSELLFLHRLDPWQPTDTVAELPALLTDAVRLLAANCRRFNRSTTGWTQPGQQYFVYGRAGRSCRRCGTAIGKAEQGPPGTERVLYVCPSCQNVSETQLARVNAAGHR
ncbi:MAG: nei [Frankiales bacterium]|nr:nei [Frankiales bacterium]